MNRLSRQYNSKRISNGLDDKLIRIESNDKLGTDRMLGGHFIEEENESQSRSKEKDIIEEDHDFIADSNSTFKY